VQESFKVSELSNLRTLLSGDKARAKQVITALNEDAKTLRKEIEEEMLGRYGFKWSIWTGFHAVPSMEYIQSSAVGASSLTRISHLHLHVLSDDLLSDRLKHKKHYNSFHPKLGFFLDIDEVLSWFDAEDSYYSSVSHPYFHLFFAVPSQEPIHVQLCTAL
jgi:aprataxin